MKRTAAIALLALALGLTACSGSPAEAEPAPVPTVTVTAEPVVKEAEVTPQACIDALDLASEVMHVMAEVQDLVKPALRSAADRDVAELERLVGEMTEHNESLDGIEVPLAEAVSACRGSAK